jgi:hypothetical protein
VIINTRWNVVAKEGLLIPILLYMRSLLLVKSFDFRPSNQCILVRVNPSCFRFVQGKSPVSLYTEILDIFILGELHIVYMVRGARFSSG